MSRNFLAKRIEDLKPSVIRRIFDKDATMDDENFTTRLLAEAKVAIVPGPAFGAGGAGFVRCSYATMYEKIERALDRIEIFVKSCC
jgi:aspartate/methionine/tyrosine aminotransferase